MAPNDTAQELEVVRYPDPRLRERCAPVEILESEGKTHLAEEVRAKALAMVELMERSQGIGLAAPQVGWNARLFVLNVTGEPDGRCIFVNPRLVSKQGKESGEEGCLSLPRICGRVSRAKSITVHTFDIDGQEYEVEATGLAARCMQHEMDHLEGVLIIDQFGPAKRLSIRGRLRELEDDFSG